MFSSVKYSLHDNQTHIVVSILSQRCCRINSYGFNLVIIPIALPNKKQKTATDIPLQFRYSVTNHIRESRFICISLLDAFIFRISSAWKRKKQKGLMSFLLFGPSVEIRTRGLLNPIQARYQTSPHPDKCLRLTTALIYYHTLSENASTFFIIFQKFYYSSFCPYSPTSDLMTLPKFHKVTTCCSAACFSSSVSYST